VVERAGCTAPVLYRLFGNRAGLVRAAVRSTHASMLGRLESLAIDRSGSAPERLRALAARYFLRRPGTDEAFESLVANECRRDRRLAGIVREIFSRYETLLVAVVAEGLRRGELRADVEPLYVAWRLIDLGLFRNQVHLLGLPQPGRIAYAERALGSLLAEITP
jgi:AcrR family transcriptional regulator